MSCYTSITEFYHLIGIWNFVLVSSVWLQNDTFLFIFLDWRNSNELGHFLRSQLDELSWTLVLLFLQQRGWMHLWTCFAKLLKNAVGVALASWEDQTLVSFPQAYHHYGAKKLRRPIWISIYRKVMSSRLSWLVAHLRIIRLFMKGKFDAYVLWSLAQRVQNWIVDRSTARDFTVSMYYWISTLHK